jgi:hypothetical protein
MAEGVDNGLLFSFVRRTVTLRPDAVATPALAFHLKVRSCRRTAGLGPVTTTTKALVAG